MKTDLLTIAMPVYERKEYFQAAIESAINQTVKCEIVVIDNCSSHTLYEDLCRQHNIRYIRNETNIGGFRNWNKAYSVATTPYVHILADDDSIAPTFVEEFVAAQKAHPDIDVYYTNFHLYDLKLGTVEHHKHIYPWGYQPDGSQIIEYGIKHGLGFPVITMVIKKDVFTGFYHDEHGSNDWLWLYSNIGSLQVYGNPNDLVNYGFHAGQDTANFTTQIQLRISAAYIYHLLAEKYKGNKPLYDLAKKREHINLLNFMANAPVSYTDGLAGKSGIYAAYYNNVIAANNLYRTLSKTPRNIKWFFYRVLRKLKLIKVIFKKLLARLKLDNLHALSAVYIKQVFASIFIKAGSVLITLLYVPLALGYLSAEKYGIWVTLTTIVNWVGVLDIGMSNGLRNKLAEALAKEDLKLGKIYISTAYFLMGAIFLGAMVVFLAINPFINWQSILNTHAIPAHDLYVITSLVVSCVILRFIVDTITMVDAAHGNSARAAMLLAISSGVSLVLVWLATLFTPKGNILLLSGIVTVVPVLVYIVYSLIVFTKRYKAIRPAWSYVKIEHSKSLVGLSLQFFIVQITATILYASAPFIITQLFNPTAVTQFSIASGIFNMPVMIFGLVCNPIMPLVTHAFVKKDNIWLRATLKRLTYFSLLFSAGVILMVFLSGWIYKLWLGDKVSIPFELSVAVGAFTIINILLAPFSNFINGLGKLKILTILSPVGVGLFVVSAIVLSKWLHSVIGVSIALSITSLIGLIILPIEIRKIIKNNQDSEPVA
jgi:O-antigen/teichoic acid export membrane protein/glycosyltransferase involved in cell wall biosynthesis